MAESASVSSSEIEAILKDKVRAVHVEAKDVSSCGQSYSLIIVSPSFEGLSTLNRHKLVNSALQDQIARLHAFSQRTFTPREFEAHQQQQQQQQS